MTLRCGSNPLSLNAPRFLPPDISSAVPVCNALSLVFTAATAAVLGERVDRPLQTLLGMLLVLAGLAVCVTSKA